MKTGNIRSLVKQGKASSAGRMHCRLRSFLGAVVAALVCTCFLSVAGCGDGTATGDLVSPDEMGKKLNKSLPKGTSLDVAKEFMAKEGFSCEPKVDAVWKRKPHVNYILCKREDGAPPIKRLWEAAVIHDGASVLAVDLRSALIYP